jgi:Arc/MetJ-type ribon-helix-helix transcriptional regulator
MATKKKVQLSVTLDEVQLAWMDKEIEDNRFATRSHAIVYALTRLMKEDAEIAINRKTVKRSLQQLK